MEFKFKVKTSHKIEFLLKTQIFNIDAYYIYHIPNISQLIQLKMKISIFCHR